MKILIVDDSETARAQLRKDLEAKGYQVVEGSDGIEGITRLSQNSDVKLIISDVNMPQMDGLTMAKKIHETPESKAMPILIMTTESTPDMKAKGKEAGVLAWVTKPYKPEKLLAAVEKILK
jgi:two-component system chemotaxis response regulator CheY